jgi:hypothetical protein
VGVVGKDGGSGEHGSYRPSLIPQLRPIDVAASRKMAARV